MSIIVKNILDIKTGVILHQVNNKKIMGAGLAKEIRDKYPSHYQDYMNSKLELGSIVISKVAPKLFIVGLVAQDGYGRDRRYTSYTAFESCLNKIIRTKTNRLPIYAPVGIGCGLAGGEWKIIRKILQETIPSIILVSKEN